MEENRNIFRVVLILISILIISFPVYKYFKNRSEKNQLTLSNRGNDRIDEKKGNEYKNDDLSNIIKNLKNSVVMVYTSSSQGSGVVISEEGKIVTNYHVIKEDEEIFVKFHNETIKKAEIVTKNSNKDLAILLVKSSKLQKLKIGMGDNLKELEELIALGNPLGLENTVTKGNFSRYEIKNGIKYIQFTAPVNHGSSGGALVNLKGELVGIVTAMIDNTQGFNFAIPVEELKKIY